MNSNRLYGISDYRLHVGQEEVRVVQLKADFLILAADSRLIFIQVSALRWLLEVKLCAMLNKGNNWRENQAEPSILLYLPNHHLFEPV